MRTRQIALLLFLLPCLLLTACKRETSEEEVTSIIELETEEEATPQHRTVLPSSLTLPYLQQQTLDPLICTDGIQQTIGALLYESLFVLDEAFEPQPCLCQSYQYDATTLTYTLYLRQNVRFHDGTPLTAQDVVTSLLRAKGTVRYGARFTHITTIRAENQAVQITLNQPNARFLSLLDIPIVKINPANALLPHGTGAYRYVSSGNETYLQSNADWWQGTNQPLERLELKEVKDTETAVWLFSAREIQWLTADLTSGDAVHLTGDLSFLDMPTTVMQYLGCNTAYGPCSNVALRQAIYQGIDRTTLVNTYLSGHAQAAQFPVSPASPLYPKEEESVYTSESYVNALKQVENMSSTALDMIVCNENSFHTAVAGYLASRLSSGGISVRLHQLDKPSYLSALANGSYDLYFAEVKLTADWELQPLVGSTGTLNPSHYTSPTLDTLLVNHQQSSTGAFLPLLQQIRQEAPIIPLCFLTRSLLVPEGMLENATPTTAQPFYGLANWTIHLRKTQNG